MRRTIVKGYFLWYGLRPVITFRELAEMALADKRLRLLPRSYQTDKQRSREVIFDLGTIEAQLLSAARIEDFLAVVQWRASNGTANRFRSLISSIYSFGMRRGLVPSNPVARVPRFREAEGRIRFLDYSEEAALRGSVPLHRIPELDLALQTGLRRAEQYGLKWSDVSLDRGVLIVVGKGAKRRSMPVNNAAREALWELHRASGGSAYVCQGSPRRWFEAAVRFAGIVDFRWHDLRHTFASRLVMDGVDIRTVQQLLGHASLATTQRYAHVSEEHLRAAVAKLDKKSSPQVLLFQHPATDY